MNVLNKTKLRFFSEKKELALLGKKEFSMFFVLIGMVIISGILSPTFRSVGNILNIFNQNAIIGVMAVGMAFVLITGAIDLSVSSTVALTGVIGTMLLKEYGAVVGITGGLAIGATVGLINGLLVTKVKMSPFVATLGTMTIGRGIVFIITNGFPVMGVPNKYNVIGMGKIGPFPIAASIWILLAAAMFLLLKYTRFGQYIYSIGGNENASWLSGVNTVKTKILAFVICGIFSSIAGLFVIFRVLIATADAATGYEMLAIASCFVGGISVDGGKGNIISSIIGTLILGLILNMLQLLGVSSFWQSAITGLIILGAVGIDSASNRKRD